MQVQPLDQEDPLEQEMATHSVFLPGKFHGQRNLAGYSTWGFKESDATNIHTDTQTHRHTDTHTDIPCNV